jgi:hypothetical protein
VYAQLLRRLVTESDVPIRVSRHLVPLRFRTGPLAWADRQVAAARAVTYSRLRGRLGIRPRLEAWAARGRLRLRR